MMKFRKKPVVIEATQWWQNGNHPLDESVPMQPSIGDTKLYYTEGKIVRYFRHPNTPGTDVCKYCGDIMHLHGWIDTMEGGHIVCPGDWVITGVKGEFYPVKPDIFEATYEVAE
jgi:hypothetical protein